MYVYRCENFVNSLNAAMHLKWETEHGSYISEKSERSYLKKKLLCSPFLRFQA